MGLMPSVGEEPSLKIRVTPEEKAQLAKEVASQKTEMDAAMAKYNADIKEYLEGGNSQPTKPKPSAVKN